jgi:multidrug efflux pump subunit AcrA (membrane-fusion protein)
LNHPTDHLSPEAVALLAQAAKARAAMDRAAHDTTVAADELRRYAKFSKPGQPSAHIVQLRQRQAAARMDSARAKQAFLKAAQAFVHSTGLGVPPRSSLEAFVLNWIDRKPK